MKRTYKRKLETPIGTFYLLYNDSTDDIHCELLDSNSKWITNLYHKGTIKLLKENNNIWKLADILGLQNITWGKTIDELIVSLLNAFYDDYAEEDEKSLREELQEYDFINQIGNKYFIIDFE